MVNALMLALGVAVHVPVWNALAHKLLVSANIGNADLPRSDVRAVTSAIERIMKGGAKPEIPLGTETPNHGGCELKRFIGLTQATAMVVGTIIGASIFVQPSEITHWVPSTGGIFWTWAICGLLTFFGSLVCPELASAFPKTGGVYVFLKEAYSPAVAEHYRLAGRVAMAVDPKGADLKRLLSEDPGGPVVMLRLHVSSRGAGPICALVLLGLFSGAISFGVIARGIGRAPCWPGW